MSSYLHVHIQPGAKRSEVVGVHGDRIKIRIAAPPVDGKANEELVRFLAEELGLARSRINLVRGETSRQKTLEIAGVEEAWILTKLKTGR